MKLECVTDEAQKKRGRPRKSSIQPNISDIRRRERIAKFGSLVSRIEKLPKFIETMRLPPQTICVTLSLPSLVLIDLYLEFAAAKKLIAKKIHHGTVIDSLAEQLREDTDFSNWLSQNQGLESTQLT